jgi:membrane-associated phospholipid phosphatase
MNETIGFIAAAETSAIVEVYRRGIEVIRAIQTIENPALTAVIRILTLLGTELFYIPVILFVFWCVDEKQGMRFGILILFSAWINGFFKSFLKQPRPYNLDPSVGRGFEPTYGMPSGHAQHSLVFWTAAAWQKKPEGKGIIYFRIAAIIFVLIIAFTRLYLGLHFPTDILGGWFLGFFIIGLFFLLRKKIETFLAGEDLRFRLIAAAIIAFLMNASGAETTLGGLFLGFCGGYSLMQKHIRFSAAAPLGGKNPGVLVLGVRYVSGMAGLAAVYFVLKALLPGEDSLFAAIKSWGLASPYYALGRFLRYGALGFWSAAGAPWLFVRMKLAEASAEDGN